MTKARKKQILPGGRIVSLNKDKQRLVTEITESEQLLIAKTYQENREYYKQCQIDGTLDSEFKKFKFKQEKIREGGSRVLRCAMVQTREELKERLGVIPDYAYKKFAEKAEHASDTKLYRDFHRNNIDKNTSSQQEIQREMNNSNGEKTTHILHPEISGYIETVNTKFTWTPEHIAKLTIGLFRWIVFINKHPEKVSLEAVRDGYRDKKFPRRLINAARALAEKTRGTKNTDLVHEWENSVLSKAIEKPQDILSYTLDGKKIDLTSHVSDNVETQLHSEDEDIGNNNEAKELTMETDKTFDEKELLLHQKYNRMYKECCTVADLYAEYIVHNKELCGWYLKSKEFIDTEDIKRLLSTKVFDQFEKEFNCHASEINVDESRTDICYITMFRIEELLKEQKNLFEKMEKIARDAGEYEKCNPVM